MNDFNYISEQLQVKYSIPKGSNKSADTMHKTVRLSLDLLNGMLLQYKEKPNPLVAGLLFTVLVNGLKAMNKTSDEINQHIDGQSP